MSFMIRSARRMAEREREREQTEVSRAEKIKRGKKVSRIHLNLDGIIAVVGKGEFTWIGPLPDCEGRGGGDDGQVPKTTIAIGAAGNIRFALGISLLFDPP